VEAVDHRAGDQLGQQPGVAFVGPVEGIQVRVALALVDDRGREAEPDQHQVQQQPAGAAVAVQERMDAFELAADGGQPHGNVVGSDLGLSRARQPAEPVELLDGRGAASVDSLPAWASSTRHLAAACGCG
jgi:hypothetical protein